MEVVGAELRPRAPGRLQLGPCPICTNQSHSLHEGGLEAVRPGEGQRTSEKQCCPSLQAQNFEDAWQVPQMPLGPPV